MGFLSKARSVFQKIKSVVKRTFLGLLNGTIQIGIMNGYFLYENRSKDRETIIHIPLPSVPGTPALANA